MADKTDGYHLVKGKTDIACGWDWDLAMRENEALQAREIRVYRSGVVIETYFYEEDEGWKKA